MCSCIIFASQIIVYFLLLIYHFADKIYPLYMITCKNQYLCCYLILSCEHLYFWHYCFEESSYFMVNACTFIFKPCKVVFTDYLQGYQSGELCLKVCSKKNNFTCLCDWSKAGLQANLEMGGGLFIILRIYTPSPGHFESSTSRLQIANNIFFFILVYVKELKVINIQKKECKHRHDSRKKEDYEYIIEVIIIQNCVIWNLSVSKH